MDLPLVHLNGSEKNCYLGTSHLLSHLIYACATALLLFHFSFVFFKSIFSNHIMLFVCKKILHKNCLVVFLSCIPACLTPVSVFTYSRFCVHLFFMGRPRTPSPSFQAFSQTILDYTRCCSLCSTSTTCVLVSLIFVLYVSGDQFNCNRSVSHLDSPKHKF